jgi:hypothetical protein
MEKTKLGLSVKICNVLVFLLFLFSGYTVGLLAVGYVLLCEKDQSLRVSAVTALLAAVAYSLIQMLIGLLPDVVEIFVNLLNIFRVYVNVSFLHNITNFLYSILSLMKTVVYIILAFMAVLGKPVQLSSIKKLLD